MKHPAALPALLLLLAPFALPQTAPSYDAVWNAFLIWLRSQPPNSKPGDLIDSYRKSLASSGLPQDQVTRRMRVVGDFIFTRRPGVELLWDKVYDGRDPIFTPRPSAIVVAAASAHRPGRALDVGMGQGRNSVYLAAQGWDVTGFDPSSEAVRLARANAARAGLKIHALIARDDSFDYGANRWDLIVVTYVRDLTPSDAALFLHALKPSGLLAYENGASENNSVLRSFLDFRILHFEDILATPDWNPQRKIRLHRLLAQKP